MSSTQAKPFPREDEGLPSISPVGNAHVYSQIDVRLSEPKHPRKPKRQTSLFSYLPLAFQTRYDTNEDTPIDDEWGNTYRTREKSTVRVWYTNPNGLGINPSGSKSHSTFSFLHRKSKANIVCLAETNLR